MKLNRSRPVYRTAWVAAAVLSAVGLGVRASAQQITFYDFDAPQANGSFSYACGDAAHGSQAVNPLFCFNEGQGSPSNPTFLSDAYPAAVDPVTTGPAAPSTHYTVRTTPPLQGQSQSVWFSAPQKVSRGFTTYFAFRLSPDAKSYATADGIAFVIQNAAGGKPSDPSSGCGEKGSGPTVVGGTGRCIGYGGIDNSLAIEFDTYRNSWDPIDIPASHYEDNHIAVQSCGPGNAASPDHGGQCLLSLSLQTGSSTGGNSFPAINGSLPVSMADGNVHQVVVNYFGPQESTPNLLQIYIDPPFAPGTHTPTAAAVPVLSGTLSDLSNFLDLMASDTGIDSAYVGFTSATGNADENTEVLAWTFTPHASSTLREELNTPGKITVFNFGSHVFGVTYPYGGPSTAGIDMIVTANTVQPQFFSDLIAPSQFAGSQCQVYDGTGGNCIVYSVSCALHGTNSAVQCPVTTGTSKLITVKTSYDNSVQPISPGFLQGDPLLSAIDSINGSGNTATITCLGECSSTVGEQITIEGGQPGIFDGTVTVQTADPSAPNVIGIDSPVYGSSSGGYLTSTNIKNIFSSYVSPRIDGSHTGKTQNFSDLVATSVTVSPTLVFSPSTARFGNVGVGTTSGVLSVTATNNTRAPVMYSGISTNLDYFNFQPGSCGSVRGGTMLGAGSSCTFTVSFPPTAPGQVNGSFLVYTNDGPVTYRMSGFGVPAVFSFTPSSIDFGSVRQGTISRPVTVTATNHTAGAVTYDSSAGLGPYRFNSLTCGPATPSTTIAVNESCKFTVTFAPTSGAASVGDVVVNTAAGTVTLGLQGNP